MWYPRDRAGQALGATGARLEDECPLRAVQVVCADKSNEIEAIQRLLEALSLRGAAVTIDAMGTQVAIVEQIHAAGADYVL